MVRHKPAHLPNVDTLEITSLGAASVVGEDGEKRWVPKCISLVVSEPVARRVAKIWRKLSSGSGAKCFSPAYRVKFSANQVPLVDASVCWYCNNMMISTDGEGGYLEKGYLLGFDASAAASQKLLSTLTEIMLNDSEPQYQPDSSLVGRAGGG